MSEIAYQVTNYPGETGDMHLWTFADGGIVVAELWADLTTGQIMQVEVATSRRGEGLATALYHHAFTQLGGELYHSPAEHRTPEGDIWARSVGGPTIDADLAYEPGY